MRTNTNDSKEDTHPRLSVLKPEEQDTHGALEARKQHTRKLSLSSDSESDEESSEVSDNINLISDASSESASGLEDVKGKVYDILSLYLVQN